MTPPSDHALVAYYDGTCPLCRREVAFLRSRCDARDVQWMDVAAAGCGEVGRGLERERALARFHVRMPDGSLRSGPPAFAALWRRSKGMAWLGRFAEAPALQPTLERLYRAFLAVRPVLQRFAGGRTAPR